MAEEETSSICLSRYVWNIVLYCSWESYELRVQNVVPTATLTAGVVLRQGSPCFPFQAEVTPGCADGAIADVAADADRQPFFYIDGGGLLPMYRPSGTERPPQWVVLLFICCRAGDLRLWICFNYC